MVQLSFCVKYLLSFHCLQEHNDKIFSSSCKFNGPMSSVYVQWNNPYCTALEICQPLWLDPEHWQWFYYEIILVWNWTESRCSTCMVSGVYSKNKHSIHSWNILKAGCSNTTCICTSKPSSVGIIQLINLCLLSTFVTVVMLFKYWSFPREYELNKYKFWSSW